MAIGLVLIDKNGDMLKDLGYISGKNFELIVMTARKYHLKCLSYADEIGNIIFNQKQINVIKVEIDQLERYDIIDKKDIETLKHAIQEIQKNRSYYLMFSGE